MQAEILDEQGRDGRGTGVAEKLRQTGRSGSLPVPIQGAWLLHIPGGSQGNGQQLLPSMPCLCVTLPLCTPVPLRLLGHLLSKDSPATPALGKFIPLVLFASLSGNLFAASEPESLGSDSSVGSSGAQDCEGAGAQCASRGPWDAHICSDTSPPKARTAGTLWHLEPRSRVWQSPVCQLGAGPWPLPCVTCLCWDMMRMGF